MENTMKVIVVRPGEIPMVKELDLDGAKKEIGIARNEDWETMLVNENDPAYQGIGIIARDQDKRLKKNLLGINGAFIISGQVREDKDGARFYHFNSLTEEQIKMVRKQLVRASLFSGALR